MKSTHTDRSSGSRPSEPTSAFAAADPGFRKEGERLGAFPAWKRGFDLACVVLTLPFWLPLMIFVSLWIKFVSSGPVFYRQQRVGYRGKKFVLWKFRSMDADAETRPHEEHMEQLIHSDRPMTKLDTLGDTRLIPGGRLLRASGLDELPQIFNVARGQMSLVGPRPCLPGEVRDFEAAGKQRFDALPGLTGFWQVEGKNKATFTEMISMDVRYAKSSSLWTDIRIIGRTLPAIVQQLRESRKRARLNGSDGSIGDESQKRASAG